MAEVALAWVTDRPGVTSTILGARTLEQLETNLRAADLHLTDEETAALDEASDLGAADYPYGEMGIEQQATATSPAGRACRVGQTNPAAARPRSPAATAWSPAPGPARRRSSR